VINDQQEEEIWIDPGMKEYPIAHWDGLGDEEEDIEYTDNEDDLANLGYKEITAFTLLMEGKEMGHDSTIKFYRGPKPSR
jgi:hypothetical protein